MLLSPPASTLASTWSRRKVFRCIQGISGRPATGGAVEFVSLSSNGMGRDKSRHRNVHFSTWPPRLRRKVTGLMQRELVSKWHCQKEECFLERKSRLGIVRGLDAQRSRQTSDLVACLYSPFPLPQAYPAERRWTQIGLA